MEHSTFANREDPIPLIQVDNSDSSQSEDGRDASRRGRMKRTLSPSRLKGKMQDVSEKKIDSGNSIQDRLFAKLLQQIVPADDMDDEGASTDPRSTKNVNRPSFSLPTMTSNFRRFNARIGVVFVFQMRMVRLLSWKQPTHTLSLLAVYTFVCLDPYLLSVVPGAVILLFLMVPSFITRHPPPPTNLSTDSYYAHGPPMAPPRDVKPVSEMSKDFFRNLRDLQNSMEDFSRLHDKLIKIVAPITNFSNEPLSSTVFLFLFALACVMFIASQLLPWKIVILFGGWFTIALGHPNVQRLVVKTHREHLRPHEERAQHFIEAWYEQDIMLDASPEEREVEIFELQRKRGASEWEGWLFSPSPYDPYSAERIAEQRPKGTRFFEDVQPPTGWEWSDKKWTLDLLSKEWVEERMITGVEIETAGERWVLDYDADVDWRRRRWCRMVKRRFIVPGSKS